MFDCSRRSRPGVSGPLPRRPRCRSWRRERPTTYLVQTFAIDAGRLETAGYGERKPVADNATPEGKQQNRRVELVKLGG